MKKPLSKSEAIVRPAEIKPGNQVYVITNTNIHVIGRVAWASDEFVSLENASFLKDHQTYTAVIDGRIVTTEPIDRVTVGLRHVTLIMPWAHALPKLPWTGRR